ncbi:hypothetical protein [Cecembia rubra]|nr:hypothetical protein [Cecembia rubra]
MTPLILLLCVFIISIIANRVFYGNFRLELSGRIAMSAMMIFTGIGHFLFTKGMVLMLPTFVPLKTEIIYFTGIIEFIAAIGLFIPAVRKYVGWLLIVFFILVLPANVHAAVNHIDIQKSTFDGKGLDYLWLRIPIQILYIFWVYLTAVNIR